MYEVRGQLANLIAFHLDGLGLFEADDAAKVLLLGSPSPSVSVVFEIRLASHLSVRLGNSCREDQGGRDSSLGGVKPCLADDWNVFGDVNTGTCERLWVTTEASRWKCIFRFHCVLRRTHRGLERKATLTSASRAPLTKRKNPLLQRSQTHAASVHEVPE